MDPFVDRARETLVPLHMIFWGSLLIVFDVTFEGWFGRLDWRFDVLNDALGAALMMVALRDGRARARPVY